MRLVGLNDWHTISAEIIVQPGSAQPPPRGARRKTALRSCVSCDVCCGMLCTVSSLCHRNMLSFSCLCFCFMCPVCRPLCRPFVVFVFR